MFLYNFERLSIISVLANLFVLPWLPLAMLFGFLSVVFSFFGRWWGMMVGFFGYLILEIVIILVRAFAKVPYASVEITGVKWWMVMLYYLFVLKIIFRRYRLS